MNTFRFDCRDLESVLEDYLAQTLTPSRAEALEAHLAACPACFEVVEIARSASEVLSGAGNKDFTASVLAATSGSACERARRLISDRVDGLIDEVDRQLLRAHLESCSECAGLATTWAWLAPELRELGKLDEMVPDLAFVAEVLDRTSRARRPLDAFVESLQRWWRRQVGRPRFVLETAYVATLLVVALCGTPVSPLREVPGQARNLVQAGPLTVFNDIAAPITGVWYWSGPARESMWVATGGRVDAAVTDMGDRLDAGRQKTAPVWHRLYGHGAVVGRALGAGHWSEALKGTGVLFGAVRAEWQDWRNSRRIDTRGTGIEK